MDKNKNLKQIPRFKSQDEEREFWAKNDSADYVDWGKARVNPDFSALKPSLRSISIRLPENMISRLKELANKQDIPYQSFVKMILSERIEKESCR
ncbi:MAG: BrnA antitoxin family protein [Minisyncoccales bacterium]